MIAGTNLETKKDLVQYLTLDFTNDEEINDIVIHYDYTGVRGLSFITNKDRDNIGDTTTQEKMNLLDSKPGEKRKLFVIGGETRKNVDTLFGYYKNKF